MALRALAPSTHAARVTLAGRATQPLPTAALRAARPAARTGSSSRASGAGAPSAAAAAFLLSARRRGGAGQPRGLSSVAAAAEGSADRASAEGDAVRVNYKGSLEDGTVFDSSEGKAPLTFTLGKRQVVPGFEKAVLGLRPGEKVSVKLSPEEAYGPRNEQLVFTIGADRAPQGLKVGMQVQMQASNGQAVPVTITEVAEDGSVTVDANAKLAGKTLLFDIELVGYKELLAPAEAPKGQELATFAAGCFWGVELAFQRVPGVLSTNVGYAQGELERPTYEDVCSAQSGHTEVVRVVFDPKQVSFDELLKTFWERVGKNATTLNKAGNDTGPQYRSGIYFHGEEQRAIAQKSIDALQATLSDKIITEVEEAAPFWLAEDYHQQYLEKGGRGGSPQSAEKGCTDTIRCYG